MPTPDGILDVSAPLGKLAPEALARSVFGFTGAERPEVLAGPGIGEDAAVIAWPADKLMVLASDPIVGASQGAGRLLVRVNVNDIASKGGEPAYLVATLILPPDMGEEGVRRIMQEIHDECSNSGIAVVGGHTEFNDRYSFPVLSASLVGQADHLFDASSIREGDAILITKHIGIEGMAILALDRPDLLAGTLSREQIAEVAGWMELTSVLAESRILRRYAKFMHDPTEGGFWGGLEEVCRKAGLSWHVDESAVPVHPYTVAARDALGFDPLRLVASGSMLAVVPAAAVGEIKREFAAAAMSVTEVGRMGGPALYISPSGPPIEELWGLLKRDKKE